MFQIFLGYLDDQDTYRQYQRVAMSKIGIARLKTIIREEIANLYEGDDHDSASKNVAAASKLIGAIEGFKESASEKAKSELASNLDAAEQILKRIIGSPMSYVDATEPPEQKVVHLKPEKKEVV
jgi:hypothetical protein